MIHEILARFGYESYYDPPGADDPERVAELEKILGKALPADYREFLLKFAPGGFNKDVAFRPLEPNPWTDNGLNGFDRFDGFDDPDDDIVSELQSNTGDVPDNMLPIGSDSSANTILLSMEDPPGRIYFWDRDSATAFLCAPSFTEFLESFEIVSDEEAEPRTK